MTRTTRTASIAALVLAAVVAPVTANAAPPASPPAPVTMKAVLELSGEQTVEEVSARAVGPGPEMTSADTTSKAPSYGGDVVADVDPTGGTVTIGTSSGGTHYWQTITVRIQDPDLTRLDTVTDTFGGDAKVTVAGQSGDWTLTWTSSRTSPLSINPARSSVFRYADAPVPPQPPAPTPFVPGPLSLTTSGTPHLRGHMMTVDVDGFAPGETYQVKISGVVVGHGTADASGQVHRKVRVPLRAHRPKAKLRVDGATHDISTLIRIRNGIATN